MTRALFDRIIDVTLYSMEKTTPVSEDQYEYSTTKKYIDIHTYSTKNGKEVDKVERVYRPYIKRAYYGRDLNYVYAKNDVVANTLRDVYHIGCNDYGIKPDIQVHYALIPGNGTYDINVDIKNLHLLCDIRRFDSLKIKLGYAASGVTSEQYVRELECTIFSSYMLSPGPDGVTRFHCAVVGKFGLLSSARSVQIRFEDRDKEGKVSLRTLIMQLNSVLTSAYMTDNANNRLAAKYNIEEFLLDDVLIPVPRVKYFSNAWQCLPWANEIINTHVNQFLNSHPVAISTPMSITVQIVDGELLVQNARYMSTEENQALSFDMGIVHLDMVTQAQFSGPILNVTAPYIPELAPGSIFRMEPSFIDGEQLPNENYLFQETSFRGEGLNRDAYRVLTMTVDFATNGNTNSMNIMAVPLVYYNKEISLTDIQNEVIQTKQNVVQSSQNTIIASSGVAKEEEIPDWWSGAQKADGMDYTVDPKVHSWDINGLNAIALNMYPNVTGFTVTPSDLGDRLVPFPGCGDMSSPSSHRPYPKYDGRYMWPIIAAATYKAMEDEHNRNVKNPIYRVNLKTPDYIEPRWHLLIPAIGSNDEVKNYANQKDVFRDLAQIFLKSPHIYRQNIGKCFANIYVYLGGTWE